MQASKTAIGSSNAIALAKVLRVRRERLHCRLLGVDSRLQHEHVSQLRAAMLADIPEREITNVHAMDHKRTGDAQDIGGIIRAELPVLAQDSDAIPLEELVEDGLKQVRGLRGKPYNLLFPRLAPDQNLDLIALAELAKRLGDPAILVRQLDKLQHMRGHGRLPSKLYIGYAIPNCNI